MNKQALRGGTERIPVRMTIFLWLLLTVFSFSQAACAESDASILDMFKPFGDLRFRFEQDWDSKRAMVNRGMTELGPELGRVWDLK